MDMTTTDTEPPQPGEVKPKRKQYRKGNTLPKTPLGKAVYAINCLSPMDLLKIQKYVVEYKETMIQQLRGRGE